MRGFILGFVCAISLVQGQDIVIKDGFLTGQDFLDADATHRRFYAVGVIDGLLAAPMIGAPKPVWMETCAVGMTDRQVAAIVEKELRSSPERWHLSAHVTVVKAMRAACARAQ